MTDKKKRIISCGVLTVSDSCASKTSTDQSGPILKKVLQEFSGFHGEVKVGKIVPDEEKDIKETLISWVDEEGIDFIVTTGGTGFSPRDVTPEATSKVIEKEAVGVVIGLIAASLSITPFGVLSRLKCGIRGSSLILNLPGSKKGAEECLRYVLPVIDHAVSLIKNDLTAVKDYHKNRGCVSENNSKQFMFELEENQANGALSHAPSGHHYMVAHHGIRGQLGGLHHLPGNEHLAHGMYDHGHGHGPLHHGHGPLHHGHGPLHHGHINSVETMQTLTEEDLDLDNLDKDLEAELLALGDKPISSPKPMARKSDIESDIPVKVARRERKSKFTLTSMKEATKIVMDNAVRLPTIEVAYTDCLGYILAEDIRSPISIPQFPASIKDGYAVIASDTPGDLDVVGASLCEPFNKNADGVSGSRLARGQVMRINTGAPLPLGANAVVQVEDTELLEETKQGDEEIKVRILTQASVGQDIRKPGSDIKEGALILESGIHLGPSEIGILASIGVTKVKVFKKPVVAVMSTGSELKEADGSSLHPGQIHDSNRIMILSAVKERGFETVDLGIVKDDQQALKESLLNAINCADVVITSGGVSMGEKDFLKSTLQSIGGSIHFGRVFMKPGKPTTFATVDAENRKKLFFALPGNPVSAIVTFNLFAIPAIRKMSGWALPDPTVVKARVSSDIKLDSRPEYHRCHISWVNNDPTPWVMSTGNQMSSRLTSMHQANALMVLPPKSDECQSLSRGNLVDVMLIDRL